MIKLIVSDMDETLLNKDHKISAENEAAIRKAQAAGLKFAVATGRSYTDAREALDDTQIRCEYILSSGAEVRDEDGNLVHCNNLTYEDLKIINRITEDCDVQGSFLTSSQDSYIIGEKGERLDDMLIWETRCFFENGTDEELRKTDHYKQRMRDIKSIDDVSFFEKNKMTVIKAFAISTDLDKMIEAKIEMVHEPTLSTASAVDQSIEITSVHAQKGIVLEQFIKEHGYKPDEVIIFGDSPNDVSMFDLDLAAKVAVANACEEVKAYATHITKSNDENGVAYAIEKLLAGELDDLADR